MGKIHVTRKGKYYQLNGETWKPDQFFGIDGFKWANHLIAWIMGGYNGETGGSHLDRAERYIEQEVIGNGCKRMRSPLEFLFWTGPYFNLLRGNPAPYNIPNVANTLDLVNLNVGTGSSFSLTPRFKKLLRMFVVLARKHDIVIEIPLLWTIKGIAPKKGTFHPDPRVENGHRVSAWNEHYLVNVSQYIEKLYTEGDGEGAHRVDPGGLNLMFDDCNEYTAHADVFTPNQLRGIARRWRTRDCPSQPVNLISQSSGEIRYDPPLQSKEGNEGFTGPCVHFPRDGEWRQSGRYARQKWTEELIDCNESMLGMDQLQREFWVAIVPKWAGLGTKNMDGWHRMHELFVINKIYTTFHTFRGMDAGWPETPQGIVEGTLRELTGGAGLEPIPIPLDPPTPPEPPRVSYMRVVIKAYDDLLLWPRDDPDDPGPEEWDEFLRGGGTEAQMRERMIRGKEFRTRNRV